MNEFISRFLTHTHPFFSEAPHYGNYVQQTQNTYSPSPYPSFLTFESDANISDNNNTYEILTYPNNPDGSKRNPISKNVIYDCIYYWPHFTEIDVKLEHDIMIFSASKHTGHAGSRLGWALVKDPEIAELMRDFSEVRRGGNNHHNPSSLCVLTRRGFALS